MYCVRGQRQKWHALHQQCRRINTSLTLILPIIVNPNPNLPLLNSYPVIDPTIGITCAGREVSAERRLSPQCGAYRHTSCWNHHRRSAGRMTRAQSQTWGKGRPQESLQEGVVRMTVRCFRFRSRILPLASRPRSHAFLTWCLCLECEQQRVNDGIIINIHINWWQLKGFVERLIIPEAHFLIPSGKAVNWSQRYNLPVLLCGSVVTNGLETSLLNGVGCLCARHCWIK